MISYTVTPGLAFNVPGVVKVKSLAARVKFSSIAYVTTQSMHWFDAIEYIAMTSSRRFSRV